MILDRARAARALSDADPTLVVYVAHKGSVATLRGALDSLAAQAGIVGRLAVVVGEDRGAPRLPVGLGRDIPGAFVHCLLRAGSPSSARNDLLDLVRGTARRCQALVRLDGDDVLASSTVLKDIEGRVRRCSSAPRRHRVNALLFGNLQSRDGCVLPRANLPEGKLLTRRGLLARLDGMAEGEAACELPSCNLVLLTGSVARYPELPSAEDHALTAGLLARRAVVVDDSVVQTIYRLGGTATSASLQGGTYRAARSLILKAAWSER